MLNPIQSKTQRKRKKFITFTTTHGIAISFNPERVSEDDLVGTLNSLGHSILSPDPTQELRDEAGLTAEQDDVSGV